LKTENIPVVIVGAGPAGATASLFLSKSGISHTLIDKCDFPRDKICGDALSGKVINQLKRLDPALPGELLKLSDTFIESSGVRFVSPKGFSLEAPFKSVHNKDAFPPGFISRRIDFDHFLVSRLQAESCDFRPRHELKSAGRHANGIALKIKKESGETYEIKASLVIAADGAHSIISRQLAGSRVDPAHHSGGIRAYYKGVTEMHPQNFIELHFLPEILPGYFWIFPLPNGMANVGVGIPTKYISKRNISLKDQMLRAIKEHPEFKRRFENAEIHGKVQGWGLPLGSKKRMLSGNNYILAGDAASLIDPFTGEGIGNAMVCGRLAAEAAQRSLASKDFSANELSHYDKRVYHYLWDELKLSYSLQKLVRFPWLFDIVVKKSNKNETLKETISCMFDDVDIRSKFRDPLFCLKILFG
jgi:geranylgeranyl reductase family protein